MRKKIAAGNWKMNLDAKQAQQLTSELIDLLKDSPCPEVDVILGPPSVHLQNVVSLSANTNNLHIASQNVHQNENGAFTGEISAAMIKSIGCKYAIIGHSERRAYFGEDSRLLKEKIKISLTHGLRPIFCLGELLPDRESGRTFEVVKKQLVDACFGFTAEEFAQLIVAYEPVWAIGTGKTASPEQAQEVHAFLRALILEQYGETVAEGCSILYGGSVKPANAKELFGCPDIDGGLVGGASLKSQDFIEIIRAF